jgi:uncharacterized small protein (DUF1192 family)
MKELRDIRDELRQRIALLRAKIELDELQATH